MCPTVETRVMTEGTKGRVEESGGLEGKSGLLAWYPFEKSVGVIPSSPSSCEKAVRSCVAWHLMLHQIIFLAT